MNSLPIQKSSSLPLPLKKRGRRNEWLPREEEYKLVQDYQETQDQRAINRLVQSYESFIRRITNRISIRYGREQEDIFHEGVIGFIEAVKRFDVSMGNRLSVYSSYWIKEFALKSVRDSYGVEQAPVRIPSSARAKLRAYYNYIKDKGYNESQLTPAQSEEVCAAVGTSIKNIDRIKGVFSRGARVSLDAPVRDSDGLDSGASFSDRLVDPSESSFDIVNAQKECDMVQMLLNQANLKERERDIIERRILCDEPDTLEILGNKYGITRERVRQIERKALAKIARSARSLLSDKLGVVKPEFKHFEIG